MRWLIAAGGTGGHVFPALGLAHGFRRADPQAQVLFVGTRRGLEARVVPAQGFPLKTIPSRGFVGLGWKAKLRTLLGLPWTAIRCASVLALFRPHLVMGMGGYVAGPLVLVAALSRFPTAIAEQNAVAGRTNRALARFARRIFVTFPESAPAFPSAKVRVTGNPVRSELLESARSGRTARWAGKAGQEFRLLVFGGSQGARGINRAMLEALPRLRNFPFPLRVLHQAGSGQIPELAAAYHASGIANEVVPFIQAMDEAYLWAHLVLCRAGATSLAEIALFGKPSILVPFPFASDDHQSRNAGVFEAAGAAVLAQERELSGEKLAGLLHTLAQDPPRLARMGEQATGMARPDAAESIVAECMRLVRGEESHG